MSSDPAKCKGCCKAQAHRSVHIAAILLYQARQCSVVQAIFAHVFTSVGRIRHNFGALPISKAPSWWCFSWLVWRPEATKHAHEGRKESTAHEDTRGIIPETKASPWSCFCRHAQPFEELNYRHAQPFEELNYPAIQVQCYEKTMHVQVEDDSKEGLQQRDVWGGVRPYSCRLERCMRIQSRSLQPWPTMPLVRVSWYISLESFLFWLLLQITLRKVSFFPGGHFLWCESNEGRLW